MAEWVCIAEKEADPATLEPIEIQTEEDGTLLLSSVTAQFPGTTGLKYRNPENNALRAVKCSPEGVLSAPTKDGWGDHQYFCVKPAGTKRKADDSAKGEGEQAPDSKKKATEADGAAVGSDEPIDLICLGLPFDSTEEDVKKYFRGEFGELSMCEIKLKHNGKSKGNSNKDMFKLVQ